MDFQRRGAGDTTYLFNLGDGNDEISDYDTAAGNTDRLQLGSGISSANTTMTRTGTDLTLGFGADSVTLEGYFSDAAYRIEEIDFGYSIWHYADVAAHTSYIGTADANSMNGLVDYANLINGMAGNDTLNGGTLADTLNGGDGDDVIKGNAGDDILLGGQGNDTYVFKHGDGADLITDTDQTVGNTDVLQFDDIAASQLWFARNNNDLQVSVIGTSDSVTVKDWFVGSMYHVEQIETSDGMRLLDTQVQNMIQAMAGFNVPAVGQTALPVDYQAALAPAFAASWHRG